MNSKKPQYVVTRSKFKDNLVISSVRITRDNIQYVRKWAVGSKLRGYDGSPTDRYLELAGGQIARQGDVIAQLIDGRYMAFKHDTWAAMTLLIGLTPFYVED